MEGYHVISCESKDDVITVPIPPSCKPLSCSVQTKGGTTGLLASFYDPEAHTWVVRHAPVDVGHVTVTVKVLALVDTARAYEIFVAATSAVVGAGVDELFELKRRSFAYRTARERRFEVGDDGQPRAWPPVGLERPKYPRDLVTLCAPLPMLSGYVLCGGGFVSDYPIYNTGPAMPIVTDRFYDCVVGEDAAFFAAVAAEARGAETAGNSTDPFLVYNLLKPKEQERNSRAVGKADDGVEYAAWSVTAAPNAALACFSIGLRSRRVRAATSVVASSSLPRNSIPNIASASAPSAKLRDSDESLNASTHTPSRSHRPAVFTTPHALGQSHLMSPSRFSSPDSEALSSPDSTLDDAAAAESGKESVGHFAGQEDATGMILSGLTTNTAIISSTGQLPSSIPRDATALTRRQDAPLIFRGGDLESADNLGRELQARKDLMRMVALRRLLAIVYRLQSHVIDVNLPPPHGKIRARYGMCSETRAAAEQFYR